MTDALPEALTRVVGGLVASQSRLVVDAIEAAKAVTKEEVRDMQGQIQSMLKETESEIKGAVEKAEVSLFHARLRS